MPNLPQKKATAADLAVLLIAAALTILSLLRFFPSENKKPDTFAVDADGAAQIYSLTEDAAFSVESGGFTLTITVNGDERSVSVSDSDCPDRVCVHTGSISRAGQTIVCVPARLVIRILSPDAPEEGGEHDADFIIG